MTAQTRCMETLNAKQVEDFIYPLLREGWKMNPWLHPTNRPWEQTWGANTVMVWNLVKAATMEELLALKPVVEVPKVNEYENNEDFVSMAADATPNGEVAKLIAQGWTQVGYNGTKNLVQLQKPKAKAGA